MNNRFLAEPQAIRTIFFDAGFTLLHPNPSIAEICQEVCAKLGLHVHLEALQTSIKAIESQFFQAKPLRHVWDHEASIRNLWLDFYTSLLRPVIEEKNEPLLLKLAQQLIEEFGYHTRWQLYEDVLPTLELLHQRGYTMGVISDWGIALHTILRQHNLLQYFDCTVASASVRWAKPSPTLYETALERSNSIPEFSIHVGDSYVHDVLGARSVGITPIFLDRSKQIQVENLDCVMINSLTELVDLLELA